MGMSTRPAAKKHVVYSAKHFPTIYLSLAVDSFVFNFLLASVDGLGSFRIVSGGTGCHDFTTDLSGPVSVPYTGGVGRYQDVEV